MPSSQPENISTIVKWIDEVDPRSMLDVGVGFGKFGVLAREYTDIRHGRYEQKEWQVVIDGIEVFSRYCNPVWQVYNRVYCQDAIELLPHLKNYELILLGDVIEHFSRLEGRAVLDACMRLATKAIIVSTPLGPYPQGALFGNTHERHQSEWKVADFPGWELRFDGRCLSCLFRKKAP